MHEPSNRREASASVGCKACGVCPCSDAIHLFEFRRCVIGILSFPSGHCQNSLVELKEGGQQWFDPTSQAKPFSDRSCRKTSTGSRSRRSHLRSASRSLSVSPRNPVRT